MFNTIKKHKLAVFFIVFVILLILFLPFIINYYFHCNAPISFFDVSYSVGDLLSYYGTVLSFLGTIILGTITIIQTFNSQKKTDEVNRLNLELTKRSMAMAEQNFQPNSISTNSLPKFELRNSGCNGIYSNLTVILKNVSSFIVSNLKSVSFDALDSNQQCLISSENVSFQNKSLSSGQEITVEFHNSELCTITQPASHFNNTREYWKNIQLIWKFCCEDEHYNIHYFKASLNIASTETFTGGTWEIERIG